MSVHKKLMQARVKLHSMELKKSGENKFAGYRYFELGDFLPQTMKIFAELGLCSVVSFDADYASLSITDTDDSSTVTIKSPMAEANLKGAHPIQNLGAVESYQRRYLWLAAMEITENDIIDAAPQVKPEQVAAPKSEPKSAPPAEIKGEPGGWSINVSTSPGADVPAWLGTVDQAVHAALSMASKEDDVMQIFKKNKQLFEAVKAADASHFKSLMGKFTEVKNSLQG